MGKKQSSGKVIKCDNSECKIQWFHWKCVGVKQQRVEWYCPDCRRYSYATSSLHPKFKNRNIQSNKNDEESEYKMQTTDPNPPKDNESIGNGIICTCKKVLSEEKRIKCDNSLCAVQWYHWKCARISNKPSYEWYCKQCRKYWTKSNILHPKFQGRKTLNKQIQSDENDEMTYECVQKLQKKERVSQKKRNNPSGDTDTNTSSVSNNKKEIKIDKNDDEFIEFLINKPHPNSDQKAMIRMRKTQTFGNAFAILEKRFDKRITLSFNGDAINNNWTPQELINYFDFVNGDLIDTKYE